MATKLRSNRTWKKYQEYCDNYTGDGSDHFADWQERIVKEFEYWVIIKNYFPHDAISEVNHLLITKRVTPLLWSNLTEDEIAEYWEIKEYVRESYDCLMENFPSIQSVPKHFHLHLMVLKK